jgi:hypothetical protein
MNTNPHHNKYNQGQAMMVAVMFFLAVSLVLIFGMATPVLKQQAVARNTLNSQTSYFLAEAGMEDVVYRLKSGMPVSPIESINTIGGNIDIVVTDTIDGKEIVATGDSQNILRKLETGLIFGDGVSFHFGILVGAGGFTLSNNAGVNGNIFSNSSISGSNGAFVTGSAVAVGTINSMIVGTGTTGDAHAPTVTNSTIRGSLYCQTGSGNNKTCNTSLSNPTPNNFPISDQEILDWKDAAAAGGTIGGQTLSGTNNELGPVKINGNLTLSNTSTLTLNGTVWITGNLAVSNDATVRLDSLYGSSGGMIIVDGVSTLSNGSQFEGSGTSGSYIMLLSTNNTGNAIVLSNNAEAVILYAPNGTVQLSNNANVKQITAKTISLSNNAIIDYEQGLTNATFSSGPAGGYEILNWEEIE